MTSTSVECSVYKSEKMEFAYLYINEDADLSELPGDLLQSFGEPQWVMNINLTAERKLALANAADVLSALQDPGFYLQMPPAADHVIRKL